MTRCVAIVLILGLFLVDLPPASAQPAGRVYRIGFLTGTPLAGDWRLRNALRGGLRELGYVEGKNIAIEWRSTDAIRGRRAELAAELVRLKVGVIVAVGSGDIRAAMKATSTIPIVMVVGGDPVRSGFVASLAHPGGNVTGLATFRPELTAKRLELLKETIPTVSRVAVFLTPSRTDSPPIRKQLGLRADAIGVTLRYMDIRGPEDIAMAFRAAVAGRADAVIFRVARPFLLSPWTRVGDLAAGSRLPVIFERESLVKAGGLMSYGVYRPDLYRRAATYVDKILKGAKPADLPVEQPTKFTLTVNLKTAKALGITIPRSVLLRADEVIE